MKALTIFLFFSVLIASDSSYRDEAYGMKVHKTFEKIGRNLYQVELKMMNGEEIESFAKLEVASPENATFQDITVSDQQINHKINDGKLHFIWMHLKKSGEYWMKFNLKSSVKPDELKLNYVFRGLKDNHKVVWDWKSDWEK